MYKNYKEGAPLHALRKMCKLCWVMMSGIWGDVDYLYEPPQISICLGEEEEKYNDFILLQVLLLSQPIKKNDN
jgi:hypothetical protein